MELTRFRFPDVYLFTLPNSKDRRGRFVKSFERQQFEQLDIPVDFAEEFYSISKRSVIRGLHFQTPPHDNVKLVHCIKGCIFDVIVDIRANSPLYGQHLSVTLSDQRPDMFLVPPGFAHGFQVLSDEAIVCYKVTSAYAPANDKGIHWDSGSIEWPIAQPILSDKDMGLPELANFKTPFTFTGNQQAATGSKNA